MKILALFYQNPAGYLTSLLLLVFSVVSFAINNNTAWIFLLAFAFVLIANILYSFLSLKATRKYIKEVNRSLSQEKIENVDVFFLNNNSIVAVGPLRCFPIISSLILLLSSVLASLL